MMYEIDTGKRNILKIFNVLAKLCKYFHAIVNKRRGKLTVRNKEDPLSGGWILPAHQEINISISVITGGENTSSLGFIFAIQNTGQLTYLLDEGCSLIKQIYLLSKHLKILKTAHTSLFHNDMMI